MAPSRAVEGHGTCPRERRGLSCLGREARRERVSMRFGSTAGLTDACRAEAGEESGAGSGQPWKEPIKGSSSPRRASPCGSSVARASNSFSKKKPTTQASVSNFLIQNCWSLIQKLENTMEVEHTGGGGVLEECPEFPANSYTPVKTPCAETTSAARPSVTLPSQSSMSSHLCTVAPCQSLFVCIFPLPPPVRVSSLVQRPAGTEVMHSKC